MFKLAIKNLYNKRKRYLMMAIAIISGFAALTLIDAISSGVLKTVREKAARYFAGHINITGIRDATVNTISKPDDLLDIISQQKEVDVVSKRCAYSFTDAKLFFNGETVSQRKIIGIDFIAELAYMKKLDMDEGSVENILNSKNGILISRAAAKILGARKGDSVELFLQSDTFQYNTATMIVQGIFNETSLFGYVAYLKYDDLNKMLGRNEDDTSEIAVFLKPGYDYNEFATKLYTLISKTRLTYEPFLDRITRDKALSKGFTEDTIVIMTLNSQLAQIADLLDALTIISYFVIIVFILIVMAGILNTYRVMVYERTKEIGTMRALGTRKRLVLIMFIEEAATLALISIIIGTVFAFVLMGLVSLIDLSKIPGVGMFTENGHLVFFVNITHYVLNVLLMVFAVILAAFQPAKTAAYISPAEAMRNIN